jgi:acetyl esterase/lipase
MGGNIVIRSAFFVSIMMALLSSGVRVEAQPAGLLSARAYYYESRGEIDSARQEIIKLLNECDSNWFDLSKYLIRLNSEAGYFSENIDLFKEGHRRGFFYFIHPRMPEYKPYLSLAGFDSISSEDLKLREEANRVSHTLFNIQLPDNYDATVQYPLIFILHGGGRSMESVKKHWQVPELNRNFIKVYLQSYRHFDYNTYGWGSGDERLDTEVRAITDEILATYRVDRGSVLTAGISAGASAAVDLAVRNVIPATGFLVYCPDSPSSLRGTMPVNHRGRQIRGYICAGEADHFRPRQKVLTAILDSLGIMTKYTIVPGMGHAYPENESHFVNEGLKFLYKQETLVDSDFESKISNAISSGVCRGLSVAVNDKGNTFYYNYGRVFSSGAESPDQKTIFELGSLSKLFTLFIFTRLEKEGVINRKKKISHYLTDINSVWAETTRITKLINHTSALPSLPDNLHPSSTGNPVEGYSHDDLISYIKKFKPGSFDNSFKYSNTGTALIGLILERVTGNCYQSLVDDYIVGPMKADGLYLSLMERDKLLLADGSKAGEDAPHMDITGAFASSSGLRGSAEGIATFLNLYLSSPAFKPIRRSMERILVDDVEDGIAVAIGWVSVYS